MQNPTAATRPASLPMQTRKPARVPFLLRALNWLAEHDRRYRQAHKLRNMPLERLRDMGITREQANDPSGRG